MRKSRTLIDIYVEIICKILCLISLFGQVLKYLSCILYVKS